MGFLSPVASDGEIRRLTEPPYDRSPMAIALDWSVTIMTISAEMVVPGLAGYWVDSLLGTRVVFLLLGFALGGTLATLALMRIARQRAEPSGKQDHVGHSKHDSVE